jgi:hypothetical protein
MVYIDVPGEAQWELSTKTPLNRRKDILCIRCGHGAKGQASNCRYEISENCISYYYTT